MENIARMKHKEGTNPAQTVIKKSK